MPKDDPIPAKYLCSITGQVMIDPVMASDVQSTVPQPSAQRSSPLTFLASTLPEPIIGLIQEYYVAPKDVAKFITFVAEGEQDKAETMLKSNPALALFSGDITDLSKRTFAGITGFQYAVWALDQHMWTMIRKYLPDESAREQAQGFETGPWVTEHGVNSENLLDNLIKAYQTIIDLYEFKRVKRVTITYDYEQDWVPQVGKAQFLLPIHVINEYYRPTTSVSFDVQNFNLSSPGRKWFTEDENDPGKLGEQFAIYRSKNGAVQKHVGGGGTLTWWKAWREGEIGTHKFLIELRNTRSAQHKGLVAELEPQASDTSLSSANEPSSLEKKNPPMLTQFNQPTDRPAPKEYKPIKNTKQKKVKIKVG
jgi:hypothetical protein